MRCSEPIPEACADAVRQADSCGFARLLGMKVTEASRECVRVAMPAAGMENAHGTTHGGAIFALADHAFGVAGNLDGVDQIGLSAHIHYFSPPTTGTLEAVARKVSETERTSVYAVDVYSGSRHIASFEGIGFKTGVSGKQG